LKIQTFNTHESFYHGLVRSKLWLCENLEEIIDNIPITEPELHVLGCWDNLLSFMLFIRRPNFYSKSYGYDIDTLAIENANKLCDAWINNTPNIVNINVDVNIIDLEFTHNTVIINCSTEHIEDDIWYKKIPKGQLVCLQSTNVEDENFPWLIKKPNLSLKDFKKRFPMTTLLYEGTKEIRYEHFGYDRFMLIGIK